MAETTTEAVDLTKAPPPFSLTGEPASPKAEGTKPPDTLEGLNAAYNRAFKEIYEPFAEERAKRKAAIEEAEKQEAISRETVAKPAIAEAKAAFGKPGPPLPTMLPVPPQPDIKPRPFMSGQKDSLGAVVQTLGLMAQMALGGGKAPVAALNALTGAMNGWAEGDSIRAERDWKAYLTQVDTIRQENRQALLLWDAAERAHVGNKQAAQMKLAADLAEYGLSKDAVTVAQHGMDRALAEFGIDKSMIDGLWDRSFKLEQARAVEAHRREEVAIRQENMLREWESLKLRAADIQQRAEDRKLSREQQLFLRQESMDLRRMLGTMALNTPQGSFFWDKEAGEVRAPTKMELAQKPENFQKLPNTQVPLVDRLAVAGPVLDALDKLIDRINAAAPGQNITQGLINRLKRQAGIGEDIQQFQTLKLDAALENAAALSGGQPRISILYMLRGEAQPNEFMTASTARLVNDTTRTTIKNRLKAITGDPASYDRLQAGQIPYRLFEAPPKTTVPGAAGGWKIEEVKP